MKLIELIRIVMANKDLILEIIEFIKSLTGGGGGVFGDGQYPLMNAKCIEDGIELADCVEVLDETNDGN